TKSSRSDFDASGPHGTLGARPAVEVIRPPDSHNMATGEGGFKSLWEQPNRPQKPGFEDLAWQRNPEIGSLWGADSGSRRRGPRNHPGSDFDSLPSVAAEQMQL